MSAPKPRLIVAPQAQRDIRGIRLYGLHQWGDAQADAYRAELVRGFERLQDHPLIGRVRDDLGVGLRAWPVEHLVLYCRIKNDVVEVVRIPARAGGIRPPSRHTPLMTIPRFDKPERLA